MHGEYNILQGKQLKSWAVLKLFRNKMRENSALKRHFLDSILPFTPQSSQHHVKKTREFYQPDKFIWNNPHRASKKMYKFFHVYNDRFKEQLEPKIQEKERQDRQSNEKERIKNLIRVHSQTRQRFLSQKRDRQKKQILSRSKRNYSTFVRGKQVQKTTEHKFSQSIGELGHSTTEKTYIKGLNQFDTNVSRVQSLIKNQLKLNHEKIRNQFLRRKQANELVLSRKVNKTQQIVH